MVALNRKTSEVSSNTQLPAGQYQVVITSTEEKQSQAGNSYLSIEHQVKSGPQAERKIWNNLSLWHEKEEVQDIAYSVLKSYQEACGIPGDLTDTDQLVGKTVWISVGPQKNDPDRMQIKRVLGETGTNTAAAPAPQQQPSQNPFA